MGSMKVIINNTMTSATIKGQIALLIASKDNFDIPQATNKQAPTGGGHQRNI